MNLRTAQKGGDLETIFALSFYSAGTKRTCLVDVTQQEENKRRLYGIGGIETVSKSKSVKLMAIALSVLLFCGIFIWGITWILQWELSIFEANWGVKRKESGGLSGFF